MLWQTPRFSAVPVSLPQGSTLARFEISLGSLKLLHPMSTPVSKLHRSIASLIALLILVTFTLLMAHVAHCSYGLSKSAECPICKTGHQTIQPTPAVTAERFLHTLFTNIHIEQVQSGVCIVFEGFIRPPPIYI